MTLGITILIIVGIIIIVGVPYSIYQQKVRNDAEGFIPKLLECKFDNDGWIEGSDLRIKLMHAKINLSGPFFYLIMSDLEKAGKCASRRTKSKVEGVEITLTWFHVPLPAAKFPGRPHSSTSKKASFA